MSTADDVICEENMPWPEACAKDSILDTTLSKRLTERTVGPWHDNVSAPRVGTVLDMCMPLVVLCE